MEIGYVRYDLAVLESIQLSRHRSTIVVGLVQRDLFCLDSRLNLTSVMKAPRITVSHAHMRLMTILPFLLKRKGNVTMKRVDINTGNNSVVFT